MERVATGRDCTRPELFMANPVLPQDLLDEAYLGILERVNTLLRF